MLVDLDETLHWLNAPAPTLIVAGAGLSASPPSSIPGVAPFRDRVADLLEQASGLANVGQDDYRERLFPEALYGAIAEAYRTTVHLEIWRTLDAEHAAAFGAHPNAGHLAIAKLAAERAWPVVTTNFDEQIERATKHLGLGLRVKTLGHDSELHSRLSEGEVDLTKVHGTASDPTSIKSMAADLSRTYLLIRGLTWNPAPVRLLLIGYSGRDFDLFPSLVSWFGGLEVMCVDPGFDGGHRASRLESVRAYRGSWEKVGLRMLGPSTAVEPADPGTEPAFRRGILEAVDQHCRLMFESQGREAAVAAMMGVLIAAGSHSLASHLAAAHLAEHGNEGSVSDPEARIQTLLWAAHADASLDRFRTGAHHARSALQLARRSGTARERGRAAVALAYSRTSELWLRVPGVPTSGTSLARELAVLAWPVSVAVVYAPVALFYYRLLVREASGLPDPRTYRFVTEYLEHLIRLATFLDRLSSTPILPAALSARVWSRIGRACSRAGYTVGVFNVSKYTTRRSGDYIAPDASIASAEVLGDLVGQVIAYRDSGLGYLRRSDGNAEQRAQDRDDAAAHLETSLRLAQVLRCPSLILKCLVPMREAGLIPPQPTGTVAQLIAATEAQALAAQGLGLTQIVETSPEVAAKKPNDEGLNPRP